MGQARMRGVTFMNALEKVLSLPGDVRRLVIVADVNDFVRVYVERLPDESRELADTIAAVLPKEMQVEQLVLGGEVAKVVAVALPDELLTVEMLPLPDHEL